MAQRSGGAQAVMGIAAVVALAAPAARAQVRLADAEAAYAKQATRAATRAALLARLFALPVESGEWHVLGHFPYAGHGQGDLARVHPPEAELLALRANSPAPDFTATFAGKEGSVASWRPLGAETDVRFELRRFGPVSDDLATCYVHGTLIAPQAGALDVRVGSDDGVMVWCNGRLLLDLDVPRGLGEPSDRLRLPLAAGVNHLVAKVANGYAAFDFQINARRALPPELDAWLEWRLDQDFPESRERRAWRALTVRVPETIALEVGGLDVVVDARRPGAPLRVVAATRQGDVWLIDDAFAEPAVAARFTRFASGLHEPLGAQARLVDGRLEVDCVQRGELTRLVDGDGDDVAERYQTRCDAWGVSGNYHEFAFGPKRDAAGNDWVALNVGFCGSMGKAEVAWRGWVGKVAPDGSWQPIAPGTRSPNGLGFAADGAGFYVDNQGDWVATNVLRYVAPGEFLGHPAGLRWSASVARDAAGQPIAPPPAPATVWLPYGKMGQSTADVVLDTTGGRFGPFAGQLFCGDVTLARVLRIDLEVVAGRHQGACFPFLDGLDSGVNRLAFAPDGSLLVGETDRGWGSVGRFRQGLERIVFGGVAPCELARMRVEPDGFRLEFTRPVDGATATDPASYRLSSFRYEHHAEYGCPELDPQPHAIVAANLLDPTTVALRVERLRPGHVHELHLDGVRSGDDALEPAGSPLLHAVAWYTLNALPEPDR